jgi:hypothetical protein
MALRTTGLLTAERPTAGRPTPRPLAAGLPSIGLVTGLLVASALAAALAGCGSSSGLAKALQPGDSPAERKLERADLAIVGHGLRGAEASIRHEVAASRAAWPVVVNGLPSQLSYAGELTGAAAAIAGLLLSYEGLSQRGWTFTMTAAAAVGSATESSLEGSSAGVTPSGGGSNVGVANSAGGLPPSVRTQLATASPSAVRFLRSNANLYIGCVYDGHYNLSVIGEDLLKAYSRLGGAAAFGAALPPREVESLVRFFSPAEARLAPKPPASPTGS